MSSDSEPSWPTRDEVWANRSAASAFPIPLVAGSQSAISFFAAAFLGRNDVVFLDRLGVPDVVLVDFNREHLAVMANMYPCVTETYAEDAYAVARRMGQERRAFDLVLCDPFTYDGWRVLDDHFDTFAALARKSWVTGVTVGELEHSGVTATLDGVQSWLDAHGRRLWDAAWLEVRNDETLITWLGLRRRLKT